MAIKKRTRSPSTSSSKSTPSSNSGGSASSLWEDAPTELERRCAFVLAYGDTGTGRSTLALTAPGPIAYIHCAEKIEGIIQPFAREKKIKTFNFGGAFQGTPKQVSEQAMETWENLKKVWFDAYNWARTIVLDTETDAWELIRLAYFGGLKPVGGRVDANWGPVNADWKSLMRSFKAQDRTNVIVIDQTEDEYKESKKGSGIGTKTGRTVRKGQKSVPYMADVIVRTESALMSQSFSAVVEKAWWNAEMLGVEVEDELNTFPGIMSMITEMDEEEWT